jgi:hypothetical protein
MSVRGMNRFNTLTVVAVLYAASASGAEPGAIR